MDSNFTLVVTRTEEGIAEARRIRREVFVEEQGIPAHLDPDGLDESAFHVLCLVGDEVVGTGRIVIMGNTKGVLGRIAVRSAYRRNGLGRQIVRKLESIAVAQNLTQLSLQPHRHLEAFYQSLGYHTVPGIDFVSEHELLTMEKDIGTTEQCKVD